MRRDVWLEPSDLDERPRPTAAGFALTIVVMVLVVIVAGMALASCGINWEALG